MITPHNPFRVANSYDRLIYEMKIPFTKIPTLVEVTKTATPIPKATEIEQIDIVPTDIIKVIATPRPTFGPLRNLEEIVHNIRINRAESDPDFVFRVNPNLYDDRINLLFMGRDGYQPDKGKVGPADVYKILSFDKENYELDIISIPRDLYVPEEGVRINTVMSEHDNDLLSVVPIVENISGLPIDFYIYVDGVELIEDLVNSLGGINVNVASTCEDAGDGERYEAHVYEAGLTFMNGHDAGRYSRLRACDSDSQRMERQLEVFTGMVNRIRDYLKNDPINGIKEIKELYDVFLKYQERDLVEIGSTTPNNELEILPLGLNAVLFSLEHDGLPDYTTHINLGVPYRWFSFYNPFTGNKRWYLSFTPHQVLFDGQTPVEMREQYYNFPLEELNGLGVRDYIEQRLVSE